MATVFKFVLLTLKVWLALLSESLSTNESLATSEIILDDSLLPSDCDFEMLFDASNQFGISDKNELRSILKEFKHKLFADGKVELSLPGDLVLKSTAAGVILSRRKQ